MTNKLDYPYFWSSGKCGEAGDLLSLTSLFSQVYGASSGEVIKAIAERT
jgi:hypothetical protein